METRGNNDEMARMQGDQVDTRWPVRDAIRREFRPVSKIFLYLSESNSLVRRPLLTSILRLRSRETMIIEPAVGESR